MNFRMIACAAALACFATAAQAESFQFTIDTSSLNGVTGYLEFQLGNAGNTPLPYQSATATISGFQAGGGTVTGNPYALTDLFGFPDVFGTVFGNLPANVMLTDDGSVSVTDYLQPFTFGNSVSFLVTLAGPAIESSNCAGLAAGNCIPRTFGVGILDDTENYRLVADPLGSAFFVGGLNVDGNAVVTSYLNPPPDGAISALAITAIPEPFTVTLFSAGLAGLGALRRKRAARA